MKRVLHVLPTAAADAIGVARIIAAFQRALATEYETEVCFLSPTGPIAEWFARQGVPVRELGWNGSARDLAGAKRFLIALWGGRFDVVHTHGGGRALYSIVRFASRARLVRHIHSRVQEAGEIQTHNIDASGADLVIATSKSIAAHVLAARTLVLYPCVVSKSERTPRQVEDAKAPVIGTSARLIPLKGVSYLIEAFAQIREEVPQAQLEIVGDGSDRPRLEELARRLAPENVLFRGWAEDVHSAMRDWTIYVQPSLEDAFGITILEAFAANLPVIASAVGGIPEVVEDQRTGILVAPANPKSIAAAVLELLHDQSKRRALADAGTESLQGKFSSEKMATAIRQAYSTLFSGK